MIWESTIGYIVIDSKGNDKKVKEQYVLENNVSFADVEETLFSEFVDKRDFYVDTIRRSKVKEIANTRTSKEDLLWMAEMQDVFHNEDGEEKYIKYKVLFFSKTYASANAFITEYSKQGYDMSLVSLKLTKFVDII